MHNITLVKILLPDGNLQLSIFKSDDSQPDVIIRLDASTEFTSPITGDVFYNGTMTRNNTEES